MGVSLRLHVTFLVTIAVNKMLRLSIQSPSIFCCFGALQNTDMLNFDGSPQQTYSYVYGASIISDIRFEVLIQPPAQFIMKESLGFGIEARIGHKIGHKTANGFIASFSPRLLVIILQYFFLSCFSSYSSHFRHTSIFILLIFALSSTILHAGSDMNSDKLKIVVSRGFTFHKTAVVLITAVRPSDPQTIYKIIRNWA
jgi:hypothetical protein